MQPQQFLVLLVSFLGLALAVPTGGPPAGTKDLGHGWRTPTAEEQETLKPLAREGSEPADPFPKLDSVFKQFHKIARRTTPPLTRCPDRYQDVLYLLNAPKRHKALFYSRVNENEIWWGPHNRFQIMRDRVKPDKQDELQRVLGLCSARPAQFWEQLSVAYASLVQGDVGVLLPALTQGQSLVDWPRAQDGSRSIWEAFEWPHLLVHNPKACRLYRYAVADKEAASPTLVAIRYGGHCPKDDQGYKAPNYKLGW